MSELPYMPVVVTEERAIAGDLTNEELGAYYRLKLALWDAGGYLDEEKIIRVSRAGKRWGAIAAAVMDHLTIASGKFSCGAVLRALSSVRSRREKTAERAAEAAAARWGKGRPQGVDNINAQPVQSGVQTTLAGRLSDPLLKQRNALKSHDPTMLGASSKQCLDDANQNQNSIDSSNLTGAGAAAGPPRGLSEGQHRPGAVTVDAHQRDLLFKHGTELLMVRLRLKRLAAHSQIANWLLMVGDADRLAQILGAADQENLHGQDFFGIVEQAAKSEHAQREKGLFLPLDQGQPRILRGGRNDSG